MTDQELLEHLDPSGDLTSSVRRLRFAGRALAIAVVLLVGAVAGTFFRGENTRRIVTKSDCAIDPNGGPCQKLKRETDENRSVADTCIIAYKIDRDGRLLSLTKCPPEEAPAASGSTASSPTGRSETTPTGGDVRDPQSPDGAGPGKGTPGGGDDSPSHTSPGNPEAPAEGTDPDPPPAAPQESPVATGEPDPESPGKSGLVKPTTDGLGETVKEVGNAAGETVKQTGQAAETVIGDTCKGVAKQLCP